MPKKRKYLMPESMKDNTFNKMLRSPSAEQSNARKRVIRTMDRLQTLLNKTESSWAGQQAASTLETISGSQVAQGLQKQFDKFSDSELSAGIQAQLDKLESLVKSSYYNRKTKDYDVTADELSTAAREARNAYSAELDELTRSNRRAANAAVKNARITKKFSEQISSWTRGATESELQSAADYYFNTDFDRDEEGLAKAREAYDYSIERVTRQNDVAIFYHQTQAIWQGQDPEKRNEIIVDYLNRWGARLDNGRRVANLKDAWEWYHEKHEAIGPKMFNPTEPEVFSENERYWKLLYSPKNVWSDSDESFMDTFADVVPYYSSKRL